MEPQNNREKAPGQRLTTRILTELEPAHFGLAEDNSRKKKFLCRQRRTLLLELRGYADRDGTSVRPAIETLARKLGWGRSTVFARLDDLKNLGLVVDGERVAYNKPRRRSLDLFRAAQLLGRDDAQRRTPGVPENITNLQWSGVVQILADIPNYRCSDSLDDKIAHLISGMDHFQNHLGYDQVFIQELIRHTLAIGFIPLDWWWFHQHECETVGCQACSPLVGKKEETCA